MYAVREKFSIEGRAEEIWKEGEDRWRGGVGRWKQSRKGRTTGEETKVSMGLSTLTKIKVSMSLSKEVNVALVGS